MAYWIVEDHGFGGQYYMCSNCRNVWIDIYEDIPEDACPKCGNPIDEDKTEYIDKPKKHKTETKLICETCKKKGHRCAPNPDGTCGAYQQEVVTQYCVQCGTQMVNTIGGNYYCPKCHAAINDLVYRPSACDLPMPQGFGEQKGWICPVCGRGLAPWTSVCPCVGTREIVYNNDKTWIDRRDEYV